jgi:hypothetical protein
MPSAGAIFLRRIVEDKVNVKGCMWNMKEMEDAYRAEVRDRTEHLTTHVETKTKLD